MAKDNSWEFPILLYRYLENEELFSANGSMTLTICLGKYVLS